MGPPGPASSLIMPGIVPARNVARASLPRTTMRRERRTIQRKAQATAILCARNNMSCTHPGERVRLGSEVGKVEPPHVSHFSLAPSISPVVRNDETKEPKQTRRKTRRAVPRPKSKSLFLIPPTTHLCLFPSASTSAYSREWLSLGQMNGHTGLCREGVQEVPSTGVTSPGDLAFGSQGEKCENGGQEPTAGGLLAPVLHVAE